MSDPNYMHEFWPNRRGTCQLVVSGKHCGLPEDAPVHQRFRENSRESVTDKTRLDWLNSDIEHLHDVYWRIQNEQEDIRSAIDWLMKGSS